MFQRAGGQAILRLIFVQKSSRGSGGTRPRCNRRKRDSGTLRLLIPEQSSCSPRDALADGGAAPLELQRGEIEVAEEEAEEKRARHAELAGAEGEGEERDHEDGDRDDQEDDAIDGEADDAIARARDLERDRDPFR